MSSEQLFKEIGKRLGKQPDEVRSTLRDTAEILNCMVEMRETGYSTGDGVAVFVTLGMKGTARVMEQLTQQ